MTGWTRSTLSECCEIVSGATPSTSVDEFWDGDICWATPKDLSDLDGHYIADTPRKLTKSGLASCAATILPPNSVLFSSRAPIGHTAINTVPMATNQGFKSLIPRGEQLDAKFLLHWLRHNRSHFEGLGVGATFKEVSKAIVSRVEISLPPLSEQRRIAAILDKVDALRTKRREALAHLDRLAQSIFVEMFGDPTSNPRGWERSRLDELVLEGDSINYGVVQPGEDVEHGVPLVRVGDLAAGQVQHHALKRIAPEIERAYQRSRLKGDEILVSCVGSVGVVALVSQRERGFNIARAVARIRVGRKVDREFIAAQLGTDAVQRYFTQELRTVSQPTLNIKQISETRMICPPLDLQREFASRVRAVRQARQLQVESSALTDALFKSAQHRAFLGVL